MARSPAAFVIDASVLVELVIDGEYRAAADRLLDLLAAVEPPTLLTAAHAPIEATSALRRLTQRGEITEAEGRLAVTWLAQLELVLDAPSPRLTRVWDLRENMSAYDSAYAACADATGLELLTSDERLVAACEIPEIPVRHLRDFA